MAKHRELAKELYASRIWRTVVFAGAMLGAPIAAADSPAPPPQASKPAPPPVKVDPVQAKLKAIETANTERAALLARLGEVDVKEIDKLKTEITAKDNQIKKLVTDLVTLRKPRPRTPPEVRPVGRGFVLA
jgi:hypothetical protein